MRFAKEFFLTGNTLSVAYRESSGLVALEYVMVGIAARAEAMCRLCTYLIYLLSLGVLYAHFVRSPISHGK